MTDKELCDAIVDFIGSLDTTSLIDLQQTRRVFTALTVGSNNCLLDNAAAVEDESERVDALRKVIINALGSDAKIRSSLYRKLDELGVDRKILAEAAGLG